MLEIFGYAAAAAVGLVLGMLGAGGAILTVPIMVYLMRVNPVTATVYSLFIVGATSLVGSISYMRSGLINFRTSLVFAIPSVISIFITRKLILPAIPEIIISNESIVFTKSHAVLILFAVIMLSAAISMLFVNVKETFTENKIGTGDFLILAVYGIIISFISGLVGAGGGFLIVPALVLLAKIPVKSAVGTSLLIICVNSLSGFAGDLMGNYLIDWKLLLIFLSFAFIGILTGSYFAKYISEKSLKKGFGWFILIMGVYIIIREMISL